MGRRNYKTINSELFAIDALQNVSTQEVLLMPSPDNVDFQELANIFQTIHDTERWRFWTDASSDTNHTPDFYSNDFGLMMEHMQIDDHEFVENGKVVNPLKKKEGRILHELDETIKAFEAEDSFIMINCTTDLPTEQDHSYEKYLGCFHRVVKKHMSEIPTYRKNHPGFKLIFLIFDSSSAYVELKTEREANETRYVGKRIVCRPHLFFLDENFISLFKDSDVDYLIWYAPYKHIVDSEFQLPVVCIFNLNNQLITRSYNRDKMISSEL